MKRNALLILTFAALTLPSCNTFVGMGRDFQSLGTGIENKAYGKSWEGQPRGSHTTPPTTAAPQS